MQFQTRADHFIDVTNQTEQQSMPITMQSNLVQTVQGYLNQTG